MIDINEKGRYYYEKRFFEGANHLLLRYTRSSFYLGICLQKCDAFRPYTDGAGSIGADRDCSNTNEAQKRISWFSGKRVKQTAREEGDPASLAVLCTSKVADTYIIRPAEFDEVAGIELKVQIKDMYSMFCLKDLRIQD